MEQAMTKPCAHGRAHLFEAALSPQLVAAGIAPKIEGQLSPTMNTYSHVVPTLQKEAASLMDEVLCKEP